jgi:hypothetical protein
MLGPSACAPRKMRSGKTRIGGERAAPLKDATTLDLASFIQTFSAAVRSKDRLYTVRPAEQPGRASCDKTD